MRIRRWAKPALPTITPTPIAEKLLAELAPRLDRLAEDAWVLAQRAPKLAADPALVAEAGRLLTGLRRLLGRQPGHRLLPKGFAPGIGLHALAMSLRQWQAATALFTARRQSAPARTAADEIDDIVRLQALILRGLTSSLAERHAIKLPPDLRPDAPPPPPPSPGRPPPPRPHIRRSQLSRANTRRRVRRAEPAAAPAAAEMLADRPLPRIR